MSRVEFTKATKLAAFMCNDGRCYKCTAQLRPGATEYHHDTECTFGGTGEVLNCIALCKNCHSEITGKRAAVIAKSNRVRAKHLGIKRPGRTIPGRRFNGDPIPARWR